MTEETAGAGTGAAAAPVRRRGARGGAKTAGGTVAGEAAALRDMARAHAADAIAVLAGIATGGESATARIAAANSLLDRGFGKPTQLLAGDADGGPVIHTIELVPLEGPNSPSA